MVAFNSDFRSVIEGILDNEADLPFVVDALRDRLDDIDTDQAGFDVIASIKAIIDAAIALGQYARHLDLSVRNHVCCSLAASGRPRAFLTPVDQSITRLPGRVA